MARVLVIALLCGCATNDEQSRACERLADAWSVTSIPARTCNSTPPPRDLSDHDKIAVALYHFNIPS